MLPPAGKPVVSGGGATNVFLISDFASKNGVGCLCESLLRFCFWMIISSNMTVSGLSPCASNRALRQALRTQKQATNLGSLAAGTPPLVNERVEQLRVRHGGQEGLESCGAIAP
jgi:hypothetical protein